MDIPKHLVLIDAKYINQFVDVAVPIKKIKINGKEYYKVPTLSFVHKGGVFKGLDN